MVIYVIRIKLLQALGPLGMMNVLAQYTLFLWVMGIYEDIRLAIPRHI